jgi:hypothetical protein
MYRLKVSWNATKNQQTLHIATDIRCGSVALDEHIKGDSKTYLILLNQVVCISVDNPQ